MSKDAAADRATGRITNWQQLSASDAVVAAAARRRVANAAGGPELESLPSRCRTTVCGVLRSVTLRPHAGSCSVEGELCDGTDSVMLIWLGRTAVPGIEPGRALRADGAMSYRGDRRVVYNPRYQLLPDDA